MRIAVVFGGTSSEREVSVASAVEVIRALRERGHEVIAVDSARGRLSLEEEGSLTLPSSASTPIQNQPGAKQLETLKRTHSEVNLSSAVLDCDLVFLALHGGSGENGQIQALLELAQIPFTGSGSTPSGLAMDKELSKRVARSAGILTPDWLTGSVDAIEVENRLGWPVVVKPDAEGSSVGLSIVDNPGGLPAAIQEAAAYGQVIIERFITGREFTVSVLGDDALPIGEIVKPDGQVFDYASKYQKDGVDEVFPARIPAGLAERLQEAAESIHRVFKLRGYSRSDFIVDEGERIWFMEVNTLPGLTRSSLLPKAAAAAGMSFDDLCERICQLALAKE